MDSYEKCRQASARANWRFDQIVVDLVFDFSKQFLPHKLCGEKQPAWLEQGALLTLNQIRGYSYTHIFVFVEEFIIPLTYQAAQRHLYEDKAAFGALLRFAEEETKHQRMFEHMKSQLAASFEFKPAVIVDQTKVAQGIAGYTPLAVYFVTLALELLTQRHYVECFNEARSTLDKGFITAFRLHWMEESQHARIDILEIRSLAATMSEHEILVSLQEVGDILRILQGLLEEQTALDLVNFQRATGISLSEEKTSELRKGLNLEFLWTFIESGLTHASFQTIWSELAPAGALTIDEILNSFKRPQLNP